MRKQLFIPKPVVETNFLFNLPKFKAYKRIGSRYLHARGCTMSVAEHVNYLSVLAGIKNPNFDPRLFIGLTTTYRQMRAKRLYNRLVGV